MTCLISGVRRDNCWQEYPPVVSVKMYLLVAGTKLRNLQDRYHQSSLCAHPANQIKNVRREKERAVSLLNIFIACLVSEAVVVRSHSQQEKSMSLRQSRLYNVRFRFLLKFEMWLRIKTLLNVPFQLECFEEDQSVIEATHCFIFSNLLMTRLNLTRHFLAFRPRETLQKYLKNFKTVRLNTCGQPVVRQCLLF